MLKEFKEFALKGNVMDMAIGVVVGGAFQKIVTSLVNDIIMPTIAIFAGKVDFSELSIKVGESQIKYGSFITSIVDFLIIALSIFIAIRVITQLSNKTTSGLKNNKHLNKAKEKLSKLDKRKKKEETVVEEEIVEEPTTKICPFCQSEISYKATRCPHCTSELTEVESK